MDAAGGALWRIYWTDEPGHPALAGVRGEAIERFFATLAERKLSPKSRKNVRATLRRILASAVEWNYIEVLPRLPRIKVPEAPWDFFTKPRVCS